MSDGMKRRREVLGDAHVDRAMERTTAFDAEFQEWITETAWGGVWSRPGLDIRTRSLVTIGILAALGRDELDIHLGAIENTGVSPEEVMEVLYHVAIYAGIPAAHSAIGRAKQIYEGGRE
jgi:4-carboxymuconolactone decarboxylase